MLPFFNEWLLESPVCSLSCCAVFGETVKFPSCYQIILNIKIKQTAMLSPGEGNAIKSQGVQSYYNYYRSNAKIMSVLISKENLLSNGLSK